MFFEDEDTYSTFEGKGSGEINNDLIGQETTLNGRKWTTRFLNVVILRAKAGSPPSLAPPEGGGTRLPTPLRGGVALGRGGVRHRPHPCPSP